MDCEYISIECLINYLIIIIFKAVIFIIYLIVYLFIYYFITLRKIKKKKN